MQGTEWSNDRIIAGTLAQAAAAIAGAGATDTTLRAAEALVAASYARLVTAVAAARGESRTD